MKNTAALLSPHKKMNAMTAIIFSLTLSTMVIFTPNSYADRFPWPNGAVAAVSLAYNDSLESQLKNAVPVLDKYNIKASFYPTLGSYVFQKRLEEWRSVAKNGHELGNHTLFHPCKASKPNRDWVVPYRDLDQYEMQEIVEEVSLANAFLQAMDNKQERTFTYPCAETTASGVSYEAAINDFFIASKHSNDGKIPTSLMNQNLQKMSYWDPTNVTGKELIEYVEKAAEHGTVANITFHGIGEDFLIVSKEAHNELVQYLAENKKTYWTDTFINIMTHVKKVQESQDF